MSLRKIVNTLNDGGKNSNEFSLTFKEGLNMRGIAKVIAKNTNNRTADVYRVSNDKNYIDKQIAKYWFVTKDVEKDESRSPVHARHVGKAPDVPQSHRRTSRGENDSHLGTETSPFHLRHSRTSNL